MGDEFPESWNRTETHSLECWQWHPACAYERGRRAGLEEAAAELEFTLRMEPPSIAMAIAGPVRRMVKVLREKKEG